MKQHEREYFVSRIRCGFYTLKEDGFNLKIYMPTPEDEYEINQVYIDAYEKALDDDFKTEDEMFEWMKSKELWTEKDEQKIEGLKKDIERLKVEIFNARNNEKLKETIRMYLRAGERQLSQQYEKKNIYQINTCEGIAILEKSVAFLKKCTFLNGELYDFNSLSADYILNKYYSIILNDSQIRNLARNEPWRSLWLLNDSKAIDLFNNKGRALSVDQRNILIWSSMYDNVQESLDCPAEDIINDDDMLDGWFIIQKKKREKERAEAEMESSIQNPKIKNSTELFFVANSEKDIERIESMNDIGSRIVKQQRLNTIKQKGGVAEQTDFFDEKLKLTQKSNESYRNIMRR